MAEYYDLDKEKLIQLINQNKTTAEIAKYFSTNEKNVANNIKRYGLPPIRYRDMDAALLRQLFEEGMAINKIAAFFTISRRAVEEAVRVYGLSRTKEDVSANRKKTFHLKYGEDLTEYYNSAYKKALETFRKNTGLENPYNDEGVKKKRAATNMERYGCKNAMQNKEIRAKVVATNMERYGGTAPTCNAKILQKRDDRYEAKTGYRNPSQNPEVQNKKIKTFWEKYNAPNSSQQNLSEKAKSVLFSKETLKEYLLSSGIENVRAMAADLEISCSTMWRTIRKFNLGEMIPYCSSMGETEVYKFVESLGVYAVTHIRTIFKDKREIDIYCPDYKIGIEYNGLYYHSDVFIKSRLYHYNKSKECEEQGIRLIHIYEDEWTDPVKQEIIKSLLRVAFGKVESRIYARQCEVREITNKEAKPFNNRNHIQGHRNAKITYGLFYNDILVQLMSFSWNYHYRAWEIIRGCPGSNNIVVGGVSKLFKYFIKERNPDKIFSYCDFNKFNGVGYEAIGMKFIGETKYNKWYVINEKRFERNPSKYKEYNEIKECVVYGAGSKKYLWTNPNLPKNDE